MKPFDEEDEDKKSRNMDIVPRDLVFAKDPKEPQSRTMQVVPHNVAFEEQPKESSGLLGDAATTFASLGLKEGELISDALSTILSYGGVPAQKASKWFGEQSRDMAKLGRRLDRMTGYGVQGAIDSAAAGIGSFIQARVDDLEEWKRPDGMNPVVWKWMLESDPSSKFAQIRKYGADMEKRNSHEYPYESLSWYADNLLRSSPETVLLGALSAGTGLVGGAALRTVGAGVSQLPRVPSLLMDIGKWAQGSSKAAQFARKAEKYTPSLEAAIGSGFGAVTEANSERRESINRYIEEQKKAGKYEPGKTELEAEALGDDILLDQSLLIGAYNLPQYGALYKGPGKGWRKNLAWLAKMIIPKAAEESSQALVYPLETGQPIDWAEVKHSGITGGLMGLGMGGAGAIAHELTYDGNELPQLTDEQINELIKARQGLGKEISKDVSVTHADTRKLYDWAKQENGGEINGTIFNAIVREAQAQGVDPRLALAIAIKESNVNQDVTSPVGAIGVMQLMPETAQALGVDPHDMEQNVRGGVKYLKQQLDEFGDPTIAFTAYNAGPGTVKRYGGVPNYSETQDYVAEVNKYLSTAPEYNGGNLVRGDEEDSQNRQLYLGEEGKGEGKYWARQPGRTVLFESENVSPAQTRILYNLADILGQWYFNKTGKKLAITSVVDGSHQSNGSAHGHDAAWKIDVNDFGLGEDGPLTNPDGTRGWLADEFIAFGRSLGLGMNFEKEGTQEAHIDIALDGTNWIDGIENSGGFSLYKVRNGLKFGGTGKGSSQGGDATPNPTLTYSFVNVEYLVDTYTAADNSININGYNVKISAASNNAITLQSDGLHVDISGKVDKVAGKQLSTEDYTTAEKTKLAGIESGAQVNIIETVKVDGTALAVDANKAVDIVLTGKTDKVTNAVAGDFAGLDANGNLTDSGVAVASDSDINAMITDVFGAAS